MAPSNYDDCILEYMQGVNNNLAARKIIESCKRKFPPKPKSHLAFFSSWSEIKVHPSFSDMNTEERKKLRDDFLLSKGVKPESKTWVEFYNATNMDMAE